MNKEECFAIAEGYLTPPLIKGAADEISILLDDENFNWVDLAIETNIIYFIQPSFQVEDVVNAVTLEQWSGIYHVDNSDQWEWEKILSFLRTTFNKGSQYSDIDGAIREKMEENLNFCLKHKIISQYGKCYYTNTDIIRYVKYLLWDCLYPNWIDNKIIKKINVLCNEIVENHPKNQGWIPLEELWETLKTFEEYKKIDFTYMYYVNWSPKIETLYHERNPFVLGYKKYV